MSDESREEVLQRLSRLANDKAHIRKNALRLAGLYLRGAEDEIVEQEVNDLDEEVMEDEDLYLAHEELFKAIAKEVTRIGDELARQAKENQ